MLHHPSSHRLTTLLVTLLITSLVTLSFLVPTHVLAESQPATLIVDTDTGVDDAAALTWLLTQTHYPVTVEGIITVRGNTTVENSTNNVLTILDVTARTDIPVVMGAAVPLLQPASHTGALNHGPDGFWFTGYQHPHDLSTIPTDAIGFYCSHASPNITIVALGPLTNIAQAIATCPAEMSTYKTIVILGGSHSTGNRTPLSEFNIWFDPEAAHQVFTAGLHPILIPQDAFNTFTISQDDLNEMQTGTPAAQFIAAPLQTYVTVQTSLAGLENAAVPDVTALMYAVDPGLGQTQSALVKIIPNLGETDSERLFRGVTFIGTTTAERVPMIADDYELSALADQAFTDPNFNLGQALGAILAREPDNALVVLDINEHIMHQLLMRTFVP